MFALLILPNYKVEMFYIKDTYCEILSISKNNLCKKNGCILYLLLYCKLYPQYIYSTPDSFEVKVMIHFV